MKTIELTHGQKTIVDDADYDWLSYWRWSALHASRINGGWYATTKINGTFAYMHRLIMNAATSLAVDHINSDKLDNRRSNLRFANRVEQSRNSKPKGGRSRFKGVSLHHSGRWRAEIELPGRKRIIKYAATEDEAARLYDALAVTHFGVFAKTNAVMSL